MSASPPPLDGPVVVRSPNWLGDAIMAMPAVCALKAHLGADQRLAVAAPEKIAAAWRLCPFVDEVAALERPKHLGATIRRLRAGKYRAALLLPNSLRVAAEAFGAGIPRRIGYATQGRRFLLTFAPPPPSRRPERLHQRFRDLDLVAALGVPPDEAPLELKVPAGFPAPPLPGRYLALCPGAEYGPAKRWPVENFAAVAKAWLARRPGARAILLGAPGDAAVAAELARLLPEADNRAGQTTLEAFAAALAAAELVLANDSGAMHLASVLGTPTVGVFGSTEPALTGPLGPRTRWVRHHVPCSPCFLRECPIDFGCMRGVTPEEVLELISKAGMGRAGRD